MPDARVELVPSGTGLVGMALLATRRAVFATTTSALYSIDWDIEGLPLPNQSFFMGHDR